MGIGQPYIGSTSRANRLFAARKAAGYSSAREAATRFGWSETTYRAHETATRYLDDDTARHYAHAFGVNDGWLLEGKGEGPQIDEVREKRFYLRAQHARHDAAVGASAAAGKRLRLARRLAGFRTVTAAATELGFIRTTLNAHERMQNRISAQAARSYASAFGVRAEWLLHGALPSGYPDEVEQYIDALLELHDTPESQARKHLPQLTARSGGAKSKGSARRRSAKPRPARGISVPEVTVLALQQAVLRQRTLKHVKPAHHWTFPKGYLSEVLGCDPDSAVVVAASGYLPPAQRFDRLIVDTSSQAPVGGDTYLVIENVKGRPPRLNLLQQPIFPATVQVVGKLCGIIGRVAPIGADFETSEDKF